MARSLRPLPAKGTVKATLSEKMERFHARNRSTGFDWSKMETKTLRTVLAVVGQNGGAIQFGAAMGGKGVTAKVFLDGDRLVEHFTLPDELEEWLNFVIDMLSSGSEDPRQVYAVGDD